MIGTSCLPFVVCLILAGNLFGAEMPDWVTEKPRESNAYHGIGYAKVVTDGSHVSRAKNVALQDLASEISVEIRGSLTDFQEERNGKVRKSVISNIEARTRNHLAGYELAGTWQDQDTYWVYYRLDKVDYEQQQLERRESARMACLIQLETVKADRGQVGLSTRLQRFVTAKNSLGEYLPGELMLSEEGNDSRIALHSHVGDQLRLELESICMGFTPSNAEIPFQPGAIHKLTLKTTDCNSSPVVSVPVQLSDSVSCNPASGLTGADGTFQFTYTVPHDYVKQSLINAQIDLEPILAADDQLAADFPFLTTINLTEVGLTVEHQLQTAAVVVEGTDNLRFKKLILDGVDKWASRRGLDLVESGGSSDYLVEVTFSSRPGGEFYGQHVAFVDLVISITEAGSGLQVDLQEALDTRGAQLSPEQAEFVALQLACRKLF